MDIVDEMIKRVKITDPSDTSAALRVAVDALLLTLVLGDRIAPDNHLPFPGFTWEPGACRQKIGIATADLLDKEDRRRTTTRPTASGCPNGGATTTTSD